MGSPFTLKKKWAWPESCGWCRRNNIHQSSFLGTNRQAVTEEMALAVLWESAMGNWL